MPAQTTPADRLDLASGVTIRTCRLCGFEGALAPENFYHRIPRGGTVADATWIDRRCLSCCMERTRETARLRRSGQGVRSRGRFERKFGVEIEFVGAGYSAVVREMTARGVSCSYEGYTHRVGRAWKIVMDGSVPGGYELVSPPLKGAAGLAELKKACEALSAAGARVDRRCGLHVHHDVSDLDASAFGRLARFWQRNQHATDGLVAPSRRNSNWARPLSEREVVAIERSNASVTAIRSYFYSDRRYRSLNVASFPRYGTVEIRQHQGTTAFAKIAAWIAYGQAFIAVAKGDGAIDAADSTGDLLDALVAHGGLPAAQATALRRRAEHFAARRPVAA